MTTTTLPPKLMTTEDLLAIPDDGVRRDSIRGILHERPSEFEGVRMTVRNRFHSRIVMRIGQLLLNWLDEQPQPNGQVVGGEAGFLIRRDPNTTVGIDVAYVSHATVAIQTDDTTLFDGPPVLAVEVLSPSDTQEDIDNCVDEYLACGVAVVWVVHAKTVMAYRPDGPTLAFDARETITAEPHLPRFSCPVADFFR